MKKDNRTRIARDSGRKRILPVLTGLVLLTGGFQPVPAQEIPRVTLKGQVIDRSTGEPLYYANVFLSNTTLGAATDARGGFEIANVPAGRYQVVASMIGYTLEKRDIEVNPENTAPIRFALVPQPLQAPNLEITAESPEKWRRNLALFRNLFLGETKNASRCRILNETALDFETDSRTGNFIAAASEALELENQALGYRIHYTLIRFSYRENHHLIYEGIQRFEPMTPQDASQEKQWKKNRERAYLGSRKHFLRSLVSGDFEAQGFRIIQMTDLPDPVLEQIVRYRRVGRNDILKPTPVDYEWRLGFDNYLRVIYLFEKEEADYRLNRNPMNKQTSWLRIEYGDDVVVNALGSVANPYAVRSLGYWSWERMADTLPLDYLPPDR